MGKSEELIKIENLLKINDLEQYIKKNSGIRRHPLNYIYSGIMGGDKNSNERGMKYINLLDFIDKWDRRYFKNNRSKLVDYNDNGNNSLGVLAEFNCIKTLIDSGFSVERKEEKNSEKTFDFIIRSNLNSVINLEVYTPRMNKQAMDMLIDFHKEVSVPKLSDEFIVSTIQYNPVRQGSIGYSANLQKRLLGGKFNAEQAKDNEINILWIEMEYNELHFSKRNFIPIRSEEIKEVYNTCTNNVWSAFYGDINLKVLEGYSWLSYAEESDFLNLDVNGYFLNSSAVNWAAIIFNMGTDVIIYQNPWSNCKFEIQHIMSLIRIKRFNAELSWIDTDYDRLKKKIGLKSDEINLLYELCK